MRPAHLLPLLLACRAPAGSGDLGTWTCTDGHLDLQVKGRVESDCAGGGGPAPDQTLSYDLTCTDGGFILTGTGLDDLGDFECALDGATFDCTIPELAGLPGSITLEGRFGDATSVTGSYDMAVGRCTNTRTFTGSLEPSDDGGGSDGGDDTDDGDDTELPLDTASDVPEWIPLMWSFAADFALDGGARPRSFDFDGQTGTSFRILLTDGDHMCTLVYLLHNDQFAQGATGNRAVRTWLAESGAAFGWRVAQGGYDRGRPSDPATRCGGVKLATLNDLFGTSAGDVWEAALELGASSPVFFGIGGTPTADGLDVLESLGFHLPARQVLGGALTVSVMGMPAETVDAVALWTHIGPDGKPATSGGELAYQDAADAVDRQGAPVEGFYRFLATSVLTPGR